LNELPPVEHLQKVFKQVGVSNNSRVILYSDGNVLPATRAFFTLDYLGHGDQAALLDGGLAKWTRESRPLSKEAPVVRAGGFTPRVKPQVVVDIHAMKDLSRSAVSAASKSAVLLDVRTAEDFKGLKPSGEPDRSGHIPGAVNLYWTEPQASRDDSTLKLAPELRKIYDSVGVSPDKPVVTYCNSGMSATQSYFTLRYLGYKVSMYDGSYSEWMKATDTPVAK
jgi:thiosulfate/3-mercaptopyruvate sulfurtransferase